MAELTEFDVAKRVEAIIAMRGDYEAAHGAEDELHLDVLKAIASGNVEAVGMARVAIMTEGIDFPRYCA